MSEIGIAVIIDKAPESGGLSCRFKDPMGVAPRRSVMGNSYPSEKTSHRGLGFNAGFPAFLIIENSDGDWYRPDPVANPYVHHFEDATDRLANHPNSDSGVTYDYDFATDIVRACTALLAQEAKLVTGPAEAVGVGSVAMRKVERPGKSRWVFRI